jgi:hypothetical protein
VVQARVLSAALVNRFFAWTETWGMVAARCTTTMESWT